MILLISSLAKAQDLALALQEATSEPVQVCGGFAEMVARLQAQEFSAVILDQLVLDADPDGGEHEVVNCSIVSLSLELRASGEAPRILHTSHCGAYELGMRERDHGVPVAPFTDG